VDGIDDGLFGGHESFLKLCRPGELASGAEKRLEGCHGITQLCVET